MNTANELRRRGETVFSEMSVEDLLLLPGEKVFVVDRRLFEDDLRRHFVGEVESCTAVGFRAKGYPYFHNSTLGNFVRRDSRYRHGGCSGHRKIADIGEVADGS